MIRKVLPIFAAILLAAPSLKAQTLEEVNLSNGGISFNTYLTDINDSGFVCGYYDSTGITIAFVINDQGTVLRFNPISGNTIHAEAINNSGTVLLNDLNGTTNLALTSTYDPITKQYGNPNFVSPTTINPVPLGINDNGAVSGWVAAGTNRLLWKKTSSSEVTAADNLMPTYAGGINNNGTVCGFTISGSVYTAFTWNGSFNPVGNGGLNKIKPWGINDNNKIVGEYQTPAGYVAFVGQVTGGSLTANSLNNIFHVANTLSIANGINNKDEIVGSYIHPVSGVRIGFIYRPNTLFYRLQDYNWVQDSYNMVNNSQTMNGHPPIWNTAFYGGFNYFTGDPYNVNATALVTPQALATHPNLNSSLNTSYVDWKSFAAEYDASNIVGGTALQYASWRSLAFNKWLSQENDPTFQGACYGFAFTSAMKYAGLGGTLDSWFGTTSSNNFYQVQNSNTASVRSIIRTYLKQNDNNLLEPFSVAHAEDIYPWQGLFRLKNMFRKPTIGARNARPIYVKFTGGGYHSILPYKITTPSKLPFDNGGNLDVDRVYVYDSNFPGDSTTFFAVNSNFYWNYISAVSSSKYNTPSNDSVYQIMFNEAAVYDMGQVQHAALKTTAAGDGPKLSLSLPDSSYFDIEGNSGNHAIYNGGLYTSSIPFLSSQQVKEIQIKAPYQFLMDTSKTIKVSTSNYATSAMTWNMSNTFRSMSLSRTAALNETDNGTWKNYFMSYGTHDAAAKELNGNLIETSPDFTQGVNILVQGITMNQNDSILTENPAPFVYKITRITGANDTYDLWITVTGTDSIREFKANNIPLNANSSHTIIAYYDGPTGKQIAVEVDNGNDGTKDDTLFITATTSVPELFQNAAYVSVYPSPFTKDFTVEINQAARQVYQVSIIDMAGKTVLEQPYQAGGNAQRVNIAASGLAAGSYLLSIADQQGRLIYRDKLIKQ